MNNLLRDFNYELYETAYEYNNGINIVKTDNLTGKKYYYSTYYKQYLTENTFSSEHYFCANCLRQNNDLVKGYCRYDSLVLCQKHNTEFKPIIQKLYDAIGYYK